MPGLPPLLGLDAFSSPSFIGRDRSKRSPDTLPSFKAPSRHALQDTVLRCCTTLQSLQGAFDLPQVRTALP